MEGTVCRTWALGQATPHPTSPAHAPYKCPCRGFSAQVWGLLALGISFFLFKNRAQWKR